MASEESNQGAAKDPSSAPQPESAPEGVHEVGGDVKKNSLKDPAEPLGIIAGNGRLPFLFSLAARERGHKVIAMALRGDTDPTLATCVDELVWISAGQPGKVVDTLKKHGVKTLTFAGGVGKLNLLKHTRFDFCALKILASMRSLNDDSLLRAIASFFEKNGLHVCAPTEILSDLVAPEGMLTEGVLTPEQQRDVEMGIEVADLLGKADVGQTVVVKNGSVIAVEASEGTDACIRRAAQLAGAGIVVVKRCKPTQDLRFDLPTIGPKTIEEISGVKGSVLAIHAGKSIVIDAPAVLSAAEKASIAIIAIP